MVEGLGPLTAVVERQRMAEGQPRTAVAAAVVAVPAHVEVHFLTAQGPPYRRQRFVEQTVDRLQQEGRLAAVDAALLRWRQDWVPLEYC